MAAELMVHVDFVKSMTEAELMAAHHTITRALALYLLIGTNLVTHPCGVSSMQLTVNGLTKMLQMKSD